MSNVSRHVNLPLATQRLLLPFVGVLLRCLDENRAPLPGAFASGFIRRESGGLSLYTCWHVVTGFDPNDVRVGLDLPKRRYLEVALQATERRQPGVEVVGGLQSCVLPLYSSGVPTRPLWFQDDAHVPHVDLNAVGLYLPFWHDTVKLALPPEIAVSDMQVVDKGRFFKGNMSLLAPGDKCLIVGYPYGFSAFGPTQPTPVVLTRFAASDRVAGRRLQFLLESVGAPGMSGGPVYVERDAELLLVGMYTGSMYPDYAQRQNEKVTALGTVSNLTLMLWAHLPFVASPSSAQSAGDG